MQHRAARKGKRKAARFAVMLAVLTFSGAAIAAEAAFHGSFAFRWTREPDDRHREMVLLSDVSFVDPAGRVWQVPAGTRIDGASIPPSLWSFSGSPFVGNYRRASVVHDHFCAIRTAPTSAVHRMFRDAMAADGVGQPERQTKYAAVSLYGWLGGQCGKKESVVETLYSAAGEAGFAKTEELNALLLSLQFISTARPDIPGLAARFTDVAQIKHRRTFEAMLAYRDTPSEDNLDRLATAIRAESPSDSELENLILLSRAVLPDENSILLEQ